MITCLDFLQAGSDTTSNTLEFLVVYLIRNQDVQTKIYNEINKVIGKDRQPVFQDRFKSVYLKKKKKLFSKSVLMFVFQYALHNSSINGDTKVSKYCSN